MTWVMLRLLRFREDFNGRADAAVGDGITEGLQFLIGSTFDGVFPLYG